MKALAFILLTAVVGIGIWGNSQSKAKTKAINETVKIKKEVSDLKSANKILNTTVEKQKKDFKNTKTLLNAKLTLQEKSVEVLEGKLNLLTKENKTLKKYGSGKNSQNRRTANTHRKKTKRKVSAEIRRSQDLALKITNLKHKLSLLNNQIDKYKSKARNAKYAIVKMTKDDAKGWYYRKGGSKNDLEPMKDLPRKWNRRDIRILYISKSEKKEKLKRQYLAQASKLQKEKSALVSQLTALQK